MTCGEQDDESFEEEPCYEGSSITYLNRSVSLCLDDEPVHRRRHSLFGTWNKVPGQKDDDDQVYHCARPLAVEKHYPKYNDPTAGKVRNNSL